MAEIVELDRGPGLGDGDRPLGSLTAECLHNDREEPPKSSQVNENSQLNRSSAQHGSGRESGQILLNGAAINVEYDGEWVDGRRCGRGRLTTSLSSEYNGEWNKGRRHGFGVQVYPSGNSYKGQWQNDLKFGCGIMKWISEQQIYEGGWRFDKPDGAGTHVWFRSCPGLDLHRVESLSECHDYIHLCNRYVGDFKDGKRHGRGVMHYSNGAVFKGNWVNNVKHGAGTFIHINGRVETGIWDNDIVLHGTKPELASTAEHPKLMLEYHVECDDLLSLTPRQSPFSESEMISAILLRYNDDLRRIFVFYGSGEDQISPRLKLCSIWTWFRDSNLRSGRLTRARISEMIATQENDPLRVHDGRRVILFRECHEILVRTSVEAFCDRASGDVPQALNRLIQDIILPRFELCCKAIENNQVRSSIEVMSRMALFESKLRFIFDKYKDSKTFRMSSRILFQLLRNNGIPSENIFCCFNQAYQCDLMANPVPVIKPIDLAADQVLYEEMVEIMGRSIFSVLTLPNQDADLSNWIDLLKMA